jgi:hypothetical protein
MDVVMVASDPAASDAHTNDKESPAYKNMVPVHVGLNARMDAQNTNLPQQPGPMRANADQLADWESGEMSATVATMW